ncbi:hypothetical protein RB213_009490 [Colletotrichum asianum]
MPSTADYHSASNNETEGTSGLERQTTAQQPQIGDELDNSSDSECGRSDNIEGSDIATSDPKDGERANGFCLGPGFINQESWGIRLLSWTWDIVLTALPLFFISVSIIALKLDQTAKSSSEYGVKVEEITRLGPTIYPILFAMVVARFYRNLARWHLERPGGITVSSLEQIVGSQSFASALERLIVVRASLLLGALILLSWAMSPLGGQSSSRLLGIGELKSTINSWVYYDSRVYQESVFKYMEEYSFGPEDIVTALYSASLLFSSNQPRKSSIDFLGRPKIPQWPSESMQDGNDAWRVVDEKALEAENDYYTSLVGVNMQGLGQDENSTHYEFELDSDYIHFNCSMVTTAQSQEDLERIKFPADGPYAPDNLWKAYNKTMRTMTSYRQSFMCIPVYTTNVATGGYLLYVSQGDPTGFSLSVFNCTTTTIDLRTKLLCTAQGCSPKKQRRIQTAPPTIANYYKIRQDAVRLLFGEWPKMTPVTARASATDNYIANDKAVYGNQKTQNWTGIDTNMFSRRLTTAFNTAWDAGMDPYNFTKSSFPLPENPADFWTNRTNATITTIEPAYYVNRLWAVILILTTIFLQVLAICGLVLKCLIRGPDILGFASSLTRDNNFVPVSGGSFQDGARRARSLRNMRVRLADVQPRESHGNIAFSAVPSAPSPGEDNDGDKEENQNLGQLRKTRMYI